MLFSFEVPIAHLERFTPKQDFIFALSFMMNNDKYKNYIYSQYDLGKEVIIDNSVNELNKPTPVAEQAKWHKVLPNAKIVAPDWLDWGMMEQLNHARELALDVPQTQIIAPINDIRWIGYYQNEGFLNLAMGYNLRYLPDRDLEELYEQHFLGLNSIRELFVAEPSSCDTGLPIKLAYHGMRIKDWVELGCFHQQLSTDFFHWILTEDQLKIAEENMDTLRTVGGLIYV